MKVTCPLGAWLVCAETSGFVHKDRGQTVFVAILTAPNDPSPSICGCLVTLKVIGAQSECLLWVNSGHVGLLEKSPLCLRKQTCCAAAKRVGYVPEADIRL